MGCAFGCSLIELTPAKCSLIDVQRTCQSFPAKTVATTVRKDLLTHGRRLRCRVIPKECNDRGPEPYYRLAPVFFPIGVGFLVHGKQFLNIALPETLTQIQ